MARARVLIVEDEKDEAYIMTHTVQRLGFSVVGCAETGEKAVSVAEKLKPDIILMDIGLSGRMDGIDAALAITKKLHIPVVFLTALSDDKTLERVAKSAPYGYILKPCRDDELRTVMDIALVSKTT
jgi:1,2-diacylglycerol 3-beta-glucosyltransferase